MVTYVARKKFIYWNGEDGGEWGTRPACTAYFHEAVGLVPGPTSQKHKLWEGSQRERKGGKDAKSMRCASALCSRCPHILCVTKPHKEPNMVEYVCVHVCVPTEKQDQVCAMRMFWKGFEMPKALASHSD